MKRLMYVIHFLLVPVCCSSSLEKAAGVPAISTTPITPPIKVPPRKLSVTEVTKGESLFLRREQLSRKMSFAVAKEPLKEMEPLENNKASLEEQEREKQSVVKTPEEQESDNEGPCTGNREDVFQLDDE